MRNVPLATALAAQNNRLVAAENTIKTFAQTFVAHDGRIVAIENAPAGGGVLLTKSKSFLDFGAVGDGVADDSDAVETALRWSLDNKQVVRGAGGRYKLTRGLVIPSTANVVGAFGIEGEDCKFTTTATDGLPVFQIEARHQCRGLRLKNFWLAGSAGCGDGIRLLCDKDWAGTQYLWNFNLQGLQIEGCANGVSCIGDIFEGVLRDSYFQDNRANGGYFAHLGANGSRGVCSAIAAENCNFSQNGDAGVRCANFTTGGFDATQDVRIRGGYIRQNWGAGIAYKNGPPPGGSVSGVGFENNWTQYATIAAAETAGASTAHIHSSSRIVVRDCTFYTEFGGGRWGVLCAANSKSVLDNCSASDGGSNDLKFKMAKIDGGTVGLKNTSAASVEGTAVHTVIY